MTTNPTHAVVVGIDGSDSSHGAFAYAAWEAHRRHRPLRLVQVHAYANPFVWSALPPDPADFVESIERARRLVAEHELEAHRAYPGLEVTSALATGSVGAALVDASADADLVVVGSRGHGGFAGLLLGSAGTQLTAHSRSPVVVVRPVGDRGNLGASPPHRPVLVGVDAATDCQAALGFGFDEAAARGVPLQALYAWWSVVPGELGPEDRLYDLQAARDEARRLLSESVAGWCEKYPDVPVRLEPLHAPNPYLVLIEESRKAGLLVVSRHGGNALSRLLLAAVGDVAAREAHCPVAVVPEPA
jgi:nucleotide-binding universal stress UspA family protein